MCLADQEKVKRLAESIAEIGLQEPVHFGSVLHPQLYLIVVLPKQTQLNPSAMLLEQIDVLEVDGQLYGFSGCHRYEAHQVLGRETILCRIRKGSKTTLRMHMM